MKVGATSKPRKPRRSKIEPKKSFIERVRYRWSRFKEDLPFFALYALIGVVLVALKIPDKIGSKATAGISAVLTVIVCLGAGGIIQKIRNGNYR